MTIEHTEAAARYRCDLAATLADMDAHEQARAREMRFNWGRPSLPVAPSLPLVELTDDDRSEMARVNVRALRDPVLREADDAGTASWDELFLAWRVHSRTHFQCAWKQVDGSPLMYSHVASALHILRTRVLGIQAARLAA